MDLANLTNNCTYFQHTTTLNEQLSQLKQRIQTHAPWIDRVSFAVFEPSSATLKTYADSKPEMDLAHYSASLADCPQLEQSVLSKQPKIIADLNQFPSSPHVQKLLQAGYHSSYASPCFEAETFVGFLFLNSYTPNAFEQALPETIHPYLDLVQFTVLSEYHIVHSIAECAENTQALSPVYHRDSLAHKERISRYTSIIATHVADQWGIDDETIEHITLFSRFHDIGKVRLNVDLICKSESLNSDEVEQMRQHVHSGIEITENIIKSFGNPNHPSIELLRQIIACHHEFIDGSGYPFGLTENDIPYPARIVTVANVLDALTTHRPYRQAGSITHALLELEKMVINNKLDALCVNALRQNQDELKQIMAMYPEHDPKDLC